MTDDEMLAFIRAIDARVDDPNRRIKWFPFMADRRFLLHKIDTLQQRIAELETKNAEMGIAVVACREETATAILREVQQIHAPDDRGALDQVEAICRVHGAE